MSCCATARWADECPGYEVAQHGELLEAADQEPGHQRSAQHEDKVPYEGNTTQIDTSKSLAGGSEKEDGHQTGPVSYIHQPKEDTKNPARGAFWGDDRLRLIFN